MSDESGQAHDERQRVQRPEHQAAQPALGLDGLAGTGYAMSYSPSFLGDSRLNGRGNQPVKIAVMQRAQQTYGNRAVQRYIRLQRVSAPNRGHSSPSVSATEADGAVEAGNASPFSASGDKDDITPPAETANSFPRARAEEAIGHLAARAFEQRLVNTAPSAPREQVPPSASHLVPGASDKPPVTVHRGGEAGQLLAEAGTTAAAVGQHIVLATHAPSLESSEGQHTLAHEAAHVAQQRSVVPEPSGALTGRGAAEAEAERSADLTMAGAEPGPLTPSSMIHYVGADSVITAVAKRASKWLAKKGANISAHIAKRHIAKKLGKSTFTGGGKSVKKLVSETIENPDNIVDQGRRMVFEKEFGSKVGQGGEKIVRVVVDKESGKIVTAFPTQTFRAIAGHEVVLGLDLASRSASAVSDAANEADAEIIKRREALAKAREPGMLETIVDFLVGPSSVARDEDIIEEQRIVDKKIKEAIEAVEEEMGEDLDSEMREEVREMMLTEMETEPTAG